ncbi:sensor histidine kinase [Metabacillus sediminilitoris]|uniref:histidine kinase n=1 Tax=Metabacillus sediminilitoris TaxID=2567941 RepID=A0A4V6RXJ2_9BACI|nr:sensor histidine kinase [Metabacillus sediminilitoris]QGQ45488.1 HAMP domain-containing protein [Metabacillus sediminilitoris]THF77655.1 sensor histidine kinase [Metabacillus sediminilitoris]
MTSIRNKLLVYFLAFVLLFNIVSYAIYFSSSQIVSEYHGSFERFLLFNEISQQSTQVYEKVNAYVVEKDPVFIEEYEDIKKRLQKNNVRLQEDAITGINKEELEKYQRMIKNLLFESDLTIWAVRYDNLDQYTTHVKEVRNISSYILESTLQLLNFELAEYQIFYQEMEQRQHSFKWFAINLFSSTLILALLTAVWFSKGLTNPLRNLSKAAKEVSAGNFDGPPIKVKTKDEVKVLSETFQNMRENIKQLVEEIKEKSELDKLLKELELNHLQNQINPHFLFNTLNTISRMAYLEDANVTSRLIQSVSTLLRSSLGDINKSVTLKEEVNVVKEYFYIQKTRFVERISFKIEMDESCLDTKIPALTLQPLVENSFIHGVEGLEEGGVISLKIYQDDQNIIVEVTDNGKGIDDETKQRIFSREPIDLHEEHSGHSTGIGLRNVIKRLELVYKQQGILDISSELNKGTTIRLKLPDRKGEIV